MSTKKSITTLLLLLIMATWCYTQTDRANIRLGGDFSFDYHDVKIEVPFVDNIDRSTSTFTLQFSPAYFVVDQLSAGVNVGFTNFSNEGASFGKEFFIGPQLGYFIKSGSEKLLFPVLISAGYLSQTSQEELGGSVQEFEFTGMYYGGMIGMEYIPGDQLGISLTYDFFVSKSGRIPIDRKSITGFISRSKSINRHQCGGG